MKKVILFLLITSSFILLSIFSLESEKYHHSIVNKKLDMNTERIEIQMLYLGIVLEKIYPDNFVSLYLYDMSYYHYNSMLGLINSFNILMNTNQLDKIVERYHTYEKCDRCEQKLLAPITKEQVLNFMGEYQESRELYEKKYEELSFRIQPDYKISIWEIRTTILEKQYTEDRFRNKIFGLIDKGKYEESQNDFEKSLNTYHKILLLDKSNIDGLEGVFKATKNLKNSGKMNISEYNLDLIDYYNNEIKIISYFPLNMQKNIYGFFENYEGSLKSINHFYDIKFISWNERENHIKEIYKYENFSEDINSNLIQAQNYENDEKYEEALKIYTQILNVDKYSLHALIGSSIVEQKLGNEDKAKIKIVRLNKIIKLNNDLPISDDEKKEKLDIVSKKIQEIINLDRTIISIYEKILAVDNSNKKVLEDYAKLLIKNKLYSAAQETYSKLLILDSDNNEYVNQMRYIGYLIHPNTENNIKLLIIEAENYIKEEKFGEALTVYNIALKLDPQDTNIQHRVTYTNAQLGNESEVLILLKQYNLEEHDKVEILFLIEHYEEALKIYDKLFEKENTNKGWIKRQLISEKLYEDSQLSEKINSNLIQAQNYENDEKYEESLKIYEGILDNDKFLFKALEGALRSNIYLEKESEIRKILKISEKLPVNLQQEFKNSYIITMYEVTKKYQNSGKIGVSISNYRDILAYDEFNIEILEEYGKLLEEIQMYEEAIKVYEKLSIREPENLDYDEKINKLKKIQEK